MDFINFILSYFAAKNIVYLTAFLCWTKEDMKQLQIAASSLKIRLAIRTDFFGDLRLSGNGLEHVKGYVLDVTCPNATMIVEQASVTRAFNQRHAWLLFDDSLFKVSRVEDFISDAAILPDADVVWSSTDISVDLYRVSSEQPLSVIELIISRASSLRDLTWFWLQQPSSVQRRKNLGNVSYTAVLVVTHPESFTGWDDLSNKHIDTLPKVTYPLIMLIGEDLNFRYNFMQVDSFGSLVNGSFHNSAIGLIEQSRAEIAATSLLFRKDRMRRSHFVTEAFVLRTAYMFRQPPQSAVGNIFLLPLSRGVWFASLLVFVLIAGFLAVFSRRLVVIDPGLVVFSPAETMTFAVGAVCQQGFFVTPQLQSIRVMMFFAFVTSLFLFTSYSAKIVALLQSPSNAIQTLSDLAKSPLICGVQDTPYKKTYYLENPHPTTKLLYERKLKPQGDHAFSYSVVEGVARLRSGQFAFQVERSAGYDIISKTFTETEKCGLNYIDPFRLQAIGIAIKKHSGLKELMSVRMRWLRDTGLMDRSQRIWFVKKPQCDSGNGNFMSVGLADCLPAILVLVYGAVFAFFILIGEIVFEKINRRCFMKNTLKNQKILR